MNNTGYRKRTTLFLFVLLLVRFWLGQTFELTGKEAYLWLLGHGSNLDWCYLDRGVLVPWLIRAGTAFFGNTELGVRWIAAVIYACTGFVIFWCARRWFNPVSAFWTLVLFIVTPLYTWKLLLMTEATASLGLMALALLTYRESVNSNRWYWYLAAGVVSGLAIHVSWANVLWPLGLLGYYLIDPKRRGELREPQHFIVPVMVLIVSIPIFLWYQRPEMEGLNRLHPLPGDASPYSFSFWGGIRFIGEQIWQLGPAVFIAMVVALYYARTVTFQHRRYALLLCLCLPGLAAQVVAGFFHAANGDMMPALFLPVVFLTGNLWTSFAQDSARWRRVGVTLLALSLLQSVTGLIPDGNSKLALKSGIYHTYSYRNLADEMTRRMQEKGATVAVAEDPETASALTFYLPRQQLTYVVARWGIRSQFDFWPNYDDFYGYNFILVMGNNHAVPQNFSDDFDRVEPIPDVQIPASESAGWQLYFCNNFRGSFERTTKEVPGEPPSNAAPLPK